MSGNGTIRILLADDQETIRAGFRLVLDAQPDMTVIGEAADGVTALGAALRLRPDVLLADIRMPGLDGLELTRRLAGPGADPPLRVVVVTTFDLDAYVHTALRAGASGFLLKRSGPTLLVEAVRAAMSGDALISPQITARMLHRLVPPVLGEGKPSPEPLTPREEEVAALVAGGLSNTDIGEELFISLATVKSHLASLQRKLNVRNRVGIAAWAWESGLAPTDQAR
ncbi:response regulator transcription factor [Streptomyces sp. NPDC048161]|jgi:DNA-binding NarL/FixJ family response regulator|uniref:response regulator n=1 Tax=unclassified Streptomyces TaxID=2593676 RepID=UPI00081B3B24|nr:MULTISPECIES: response regulator transcription factor [unclassified Streptomyces]MYQ83444.1 response regulator [Streptomyces sp. SID4936]SCD66410.1 two component transcriptional regulator, LuxR family [Streptomyces sp. DvalAA-43]